MPGMLGIPGLDGYIAAQDQGRQRQAQEMQMITGLLGAQNAAAQQQMIPLHMEQLRAQIDETKRKATQDVALREARGGLLGGGNPAEAALTAGAAQGEVGPTVGNAERMATAPQSGMLSLNPQAVQRYISAGGNIKDIEGIQNLGPMGQVGKIDPKDYTPESFSQFMQGNNPAVLRPRVKMELAPGGQAYDPYGIKPGSVFADPNKPFAVNPAGGVTPNVPFQQFSMNKARAGASNINVSTEKKYGEQFAGLAAKSDMDLREAAQKAPLLAERANSVKQILASGKVLTGTGADIRLQLGKAMNLVGGSDNETISNTETMATQLAQNTLDAIKASGLGAGSGFSNADRDFLEKAVGGKITLEASTINRLADLSHKAASKSAERWNGRVKEIPATALQGTGINANPVAVPELFAPKRRTSDAPTAGAVMDGFRFKGGNPADRNSWEPAR